jgi:arginine repressor
MTRDPNVTPLERAFELARSGEFSNVAEIKKRLQREGFETAQVTGATLTKQLNEIMRACADKME